MQAVLKKRGNMKDSAPMAQTGRTPYAHGLALKAMKEHAHNGRAYQADDCAG
ncbi:hypothetical protein AtDm6_0064 [Acetobacter tropicalis]|uniref:Uncharacterized protein n=1 Tax=Acetobacter tropicalis TaxID=104102 RepID=A0A094YXI5_9PROT|nr:hypothetical protein AtDm6_0064 [Acetobacter tropicalis]